MTLVRCVLGGACLVLGAPGLVVTLRELGVFEFGLGFEFELDFELDFELNFELKFKLDFELKFELDLVGLRIELLVILILSV